MLSYGRFWCVCAVAAALLSSAAADGGELDLRRLYRALSQYAKDPDKAKKEMDKLKKERDKKRQTERRKKRKEDAKLSLEMVKEAFEKGKQAYDDKRYSEAYLYFRNVAGSRHPGAAGMVDQARTRMAEIDGMVEAKVEQARILLLQGRRLEAAKALQYVVSNFPFCDATKDARRRLMGLKGSPAIAAAIRFAEGRAQEDAGNYVEAYRVYEEVVRRWPYEIGAEEARRAIRDLRADEERFAAISAAKDQEIEDQCEKRLLKARNFLANGVLEIARRELDWILKNAPGTDFADEAEELLAKAEAAASGGDADEGAEDDADQDTDEGEE